MFQLRVYHYITILLSVGYIVAEGDIDGFITKKELVEVEKVIAEYNSPIPRKT